MLTVRVRFPDEERSVPAHYESCELTFARLVDMNRVVQRAVPDWSPDWRFVETIEGTWHAIRAPRDE
jgi:hypothetical protein